MVLKGRRTMEENKISEFMDVTMSKIKQLVDANTVVGSPITTPDGITVIPVSRVSFGFGTGGSDGKGGKGPAFVGGNGGGVKIMPVGFLIIKDGACRMINIAPPAGNTLERVVEMAPDLIDKIESFIDKQDAKKQAQG